MEGDPDYDTEDKYMTEAEGQNEVTLQEYFQPRKSKPMINAFEAAQKKGKKMAADARAENDHLPALKEESQNAHGGRT